MWRIVTFVFEVRRLMDMYQFYTHLLRIPDVRGPPSFDPQGNLAAYYYPRPISKQSPGQRSSLELVLSVRRTRLRRCHLIPLLIARLQPPNSTLMISLTVSCDKRTTLSLFSTRNFSTCAFPSLRFSGASFPLRRAKDVCLPRHWSGTYGSV